MVAATHRCENPACHCFVKVDEHYCSEECRTHGEHPKDCYCGHQGCIEEKAHVQRDNVHGEHRRSI